MHDKRKPQKNDRLSSSFFSKADLENNPMLMILDEISDGFFVLDRSLTVHYFNTAAENLLRKERELVLGEQLFSAFPEAKGSIFEQKYREAIKKNEFQRFETYFGIEPYNNWYEVRVYPISKGIAVFFQVITAKKEAEIALANNQEKIKNLNDELELKVRQRTLELANANKKLEEALNSEKNLNKMISQFVSMISHEYRTPLTVISTSNQILKKYFETGKIENSPKYFAKIENSVRVLDKLIEDVISIGKGGSESSSKQNINLTGLIRQIIEDHRASDKSNHHFIFDFSNRRQMIRSDEMILRQIVSNLISNALKYSANGTEICIKLEEKDKVKIQISDEGQGMSEDEIRQYFLPFKRKNDNIGIVPGHGLGLAIVKMNTELLKGSISIDSTPGKGTTISLEIPY